MSRFNQIHFWVIFQLPHSSFFDFRRQRRHQRNIIREFLARKFRQILQISTFCFYQRSNSKWAGHFFTQNVSNFFLPKLRLVKLTPEVNWSIYRKFTKFYFLRSDCPEKPGKSTSYFLLQVYALFAVKISFLKIRSALFPTSGFTA